MTEALKLPKEVRGLFRQKKNWLRVGFSLLALFYLALSIATLTIWSYSSSNLSTQYYFARFSLSSSTVFTIEQTKRTSFDPALYVWVLGFILFLHYSVCSLFWIQIPLIHVRFWRGVSYRFYIFSRWTPFMFSSIFIQIVNLGITQYFEISNLITSLLFQFAIVSLLILGDKTNHKYLRERVIFAATDGEPPRRSSDVELRSEDDGEDVTDWRIEVFKPTHFLISLLLGCWSVVYLFLYYSTAYPFSRTFLFVTIQYAIYGFVYLMIICSSFLPYFRVHRFSHLAGYMKTQLLVAVSVLITALNVYMGLYTAQ